MPPINQVVSQSPTGDKPQKLEGILKRIKPVGFDQEDGYKVLTYGRSGSGKTTFWATFPKPIVALVCSGGSKAGELRSVDTLDNRKLIKTAVVEDSAEIMQVTSAIQAGQLKCATLVLDHASGLQDKIIAEILGIDVVNVPVQKPYRGFASQQQWGQCTSQCKEAIRAMINLNCNVVIVAQERVFNTKEEVGDGESIIKPFIGAGLTPSLTGWLNSACDYIVYTFKRRRMEITTTEIGEGDAKQIVQTEAPTKEVEYCLKIGADNVIITKFRVPLEIAKTLPDVITNPSYAKIKKAIAGGYAKKKPS